MHYTPVTMKQTTLRWKLLGYQQHFAIYQRQYEIQSNTNGFILIRE